MATAKGGRGKPRPPVTVTPFVHDPALLAYVRERIEAGKPVGREEPMRRFGCTREAIDKARATVKTLRGRTTEDLINEAWKLVQNPEVWKGLQARMDADAKSRAARRMGVMDKELKTRGNFLRTERSARERALDPYSSVLKAQEQLNLAAQNVRMIGEFLTRDQFYRDHSEPILKELDSVEAAVADVKTLHAPPPDDPSVIDVESWEDPGRELE
jgi:hypothetical protein